MGAIFCKFGNFYVFQSFNLLWLGFFRGQVFANVAIFTFSNLLIFCGWLFAGGNFLQIWPFLRSSIFWSFVVVFLRGQIFANLAISTFFNLLIFCGWLFVGAIFCKFGNFKVLQSFNLLWLAFCGGNFLQIWQFLRSSIFKFFVVGFLRGQIFAR